MAKRKLASWINSFVDHTRDIESPEQLRRWTAISIIAGALERKVWVQTTKGPLYPNLYVVLVAPPGGGKSVLTSKIKGIWKKLNNHHLAPVNVSSASLLDAMDDAKRVVMVPGAEPPNTTFNSLMAASNELTTFIQSYESTFMTFLTEIYDGHYYHERKRGSKHEITLNRPQLNLLAGTTPSNLKNLLPEGAWDQGFMSRTFLIYGGKFELMDILEEQEVRGGEFKDLLTDINTIGKRAGRIVISEEAKKYLNEWRFEGLKPIPSHPKLRHYCSRRFSHTLKLCTIAAADVGEEEISLDSAKQGIKWLLDAELAMPNIFRDMAGTEDYNVAEEAINYLYGIYKKNGNSPVPKKLLYQYLLQRIEAIRIPYIIKSLEESGLIKPKKVDKTECYVPKKPYN